jgi:hypothetical protein
MKIIQHIKQNWFPYLWQLIFMVLALMLIFNRNNDKSDVIIRLEEDNKLIQKRNNILLQEIDSLKKERVILDTTIKIMVINDSILRKEVDSMNTKITQIKKAYEKAKSRPDYFNSDSLRWYFSTL